ncbi:hypothetical protein MTR72_16270 [Bradyrhizobium sp. ISRA442]|uniref:hypothetical protein n=1 Tax=Bradyrhizobium sp. ISRA442 TaxID=2866197 RepID=UPI00311ADB0B
MQDDEEDLVLTHHDQKLYDVKIEHIASDKWGRTAHLAEPFGSKMGVFRYDDLLQKGRAENQGCTVYKKDFWHSHGSADIEKYRKQYSKKQYSKKQYSHRNPFAMESDTSEVDHLVG